MKENQKIKEVKKDNIVNDDILARQIIEAQEKWDLDYRTGISCAKKKGITEGYASGLAEGKLEKEKLIKDLLKMNIDIETISKATGLTKDELNKLKEEI